MTISVQDFIMALAVVSLVLATVGVRDLSMWRWGWGGLLLWSISLFVSINV